MPSLFLKGREVRLVPPKLASPRWTALALHKATWRPIAHGETQEEVTKRADRSIDLFDKLLEEELKMVIGHGDLPAQDPPVVLERKNAPWR